ncbi:isoprenyl transferase [Paenibacillus senegalensis]|uniref:isoprenyl transferase n=1 Tax=Paenibacillus senegalensis TaxID=1465766 RepID=UPI000289F59B|nr:isoprenyl transferase [Paenibacillus senegalensis]
MSLKKTWFGRKKRIDSPEQLMHGQIPQHVAVIMDGNGRWASKRGLPRVAGHHSGMKNVKKITIAADELGIKILTLYAFSTENWKRPKDEVDYIMGLPVEFFPLEIEELVQKNVHIRMTGWKEGVPPHTLEAVENAIERTRHNTGLILNFAFNYGSRKEMTEALRGIARDVKQGVLDPEQIDEQEYAKRLKTSDLPDPDLLIRTSGELRISNFMLWQLAYTELFFTDLYWPEFTEGHFYEAIYEYQQRIRRYGGL